METTDDKDQNSHERLNATLDRLRQIDRQIEALPPTSKPVPMPPPPPGMTRNMRFFDREAERAKLEGEKEAIKADTWDHVEKNTRGITEPSTRGFRDRARESLYPNPFKTMGKEEQQLNRSEPKNIERSQDYMDVQRLEMARREPTSAPQTPDTAREMPMATSLADRYKERSLKLDRYIKEGVELVKTKVDIDPQRD